jgi:NADH:ubiquinone oxidoreductase subunit K
LNSLSDFVLVSAMLFGIGVYGLVTKRNALRLLFAVEIMINAANLNFVAFNQYLPYGAAGNALGQTVVLFSIALAAAEAAVILAIVVVAYRLRNDIDVSEMKTLEG